MFGTGALSDSRSFRFPWQVAVVGEQAHPTSLPLVSLNLLALDHHPITLAADRLHRPAREHCTVGGKPCARGGVRPMKVNVHAGGRVRGPAPPRSDLARRMAEGLARPHRIADLEPQPLHAAAPQVEVVRGGAVVMLDLHAGAALAKHGGEIAVGRGAHPVRVAALPRAQVGVKLARAWVQVGRREVQRRALRRVRPAGEVPRLAGTPRQAQLRDCGGRALSLCQGAPVLETPGTGAAVPRGGGRDAARVDAGCGSRRRAWARASRHGSWRRRQAGRPPATPATRAGRSETWGGAAQTRPAILFPSARDINHRKRFPGIQKQLVDVAALRPVCSKRAGPAEPWLVTPAAYGTSRSNTESPAPLGVKVREPVAAKLPIVVLLPVEINQRAVTVPASLAMLMVSVRLLGTYTTPSHPWRSARGAGERRSRAGREEGPAGVGNQVVPPPGAEEGRQPTHVEFALAVAAGAPIVECRRSRPACRTATATRCRRCARCRR